MSDEDFDQFEDEAPAPAKKSAPKKAAAKRATKKSAAKKSAPKAEEKDTEAEDLEKLDARIAEAKADEIEDDGTVEVVIKRAVTEIEYRRDGDGALVLDDEGEPIAQDVTRDIEFRTRIPGDPGDWDARVMYTINRGVPAVGYELLFGETEFVRFLDLIQPKQKEMGEMLDEAVNRALGLASGN